MLHCTSLCQDTHAQRRYSGDFHCPGETELYLI